MHDFLLAQKLNPGISATLGQRLIDAGASVQAARATMFAAIIGQGNTGAGLDRSGAFGVEIYETPEPLPITDRIMENRHAN